MVALIRNNHQENNNEYFKSELASEVEVNMSNKAKSIIISSKLFFYLTEI